MGTIPKNPKFPEIGLRARALREFAGYHGHGGQCQFAKEVGIGKGLWSAIEKGNARFSYRVTRLIKKKFPGIDAEWLTDGYEGNMPPNLMRPIRQILDSLRKGNTEAS